MLALRRSAPLLTLIRIWYTLTPFVRHICTFKAAVGQTCLTQGLFGTQQYGLSTRASSNGCSCTATPLGIMHTSSFSSKSACGAAVSACCCRSLPQLDRFLCVARCAWLPLVRHSQLSRAAAAAGHHFTAYSHTTPSTPCTRQPGGCSGTFTQPLPLCIEAPVMSAGPAGRRASTCCQSKRLHCPWVAAATAAGQLPGHSITAMQKHELMQGLRGSWICVITPAWQQRMVAVDHVTSLARCGL